MGIDPETLAEISSDVEDGKESYAEFKTGKTKTILGYSCDEYLIKDGGTEARMWVSEKLGKVVNNEMLNNQQIFGGAFVHAAGMNGMVLEYNYLNSSSGDRVTMRVSKIDLNASKTIATGDYAVMSLGGQ